MRIGYLAPLLYSLKDADRDLLRLLLMTSAARVQIRSDVDGSWSRPTSFLRDRRGFPVSSVDFLGRHRRRPVLVSGVHANFLTHVSAKAASTALTCEDCGVRFISRLKYKARSPAIEHREASTSHFGQYVPFLEPNRSFPSVGCTRRKGQPLVVCCFPSIHVLRRQPRGG